MGSGAVKTWTSNCQRIDTKILNHFQAQAETDVEHNNQVQEKRIIIIA
jgi:hypothetical protein